ncbi:multicopper oxidase family protein [Nocardioides nitrophenolicus]|uniref:multicopper oxidase family protein n=1 Tax=Nocardioides nitrophenolicus TaxID=60489 RepID=UPI00195DF73E|nr:multicopper oxidase domain-containing protein [Nocardioides nitrophenolicus]MBM7520041.1 FtsP/CotA-like multicopper oxidase with cupredoxin domain [Nocardioides nitrophenolicus]
MRRLAKPLAVVLAVVLAAGVGFVAWIVVATLRVTVDTVGEVEFDTPLAIPPLAGSRLVDGERVFDLDLDEGVSDFGRGRTPTWGVNGDYLGPTIRVTRGERVRMRVRNDLPETTTLHWHGMHLPAEADGGPHQVVEPGAVWEPGWTVDQPAATLWYHPHLHGATAAHVYRGLAGLLLVDDPVPATGLPATYGVDDVPVILQDKKLQDDGTLDEDPGSFQSAGLTGDTIVVNGTVGPYLDVTTELVRLRLLNASSTRPYAVALSSGDSFTMVASDGGLLTAPVELDRIQLSPGERAEIVVRLEPGEIATLRSGPSDTGDRMAGGADRLDLLQLRAGDRLTPSVPLPARLADPELPDPGAATRTRTFELSGYAINDRPMDLGRIDDVVTLGDTEIWEITNADGGSHSFHVHDVQFRVVDVDGTPPPPELAGRKDTVWVRPDETVRIALSFTDHASARWPYMYHCHTLRHEDNGMMGQFVVVRPGEEPASDVGAPGGHAHH